jgi:hypothetical protein
LIKSWDVTTEWRRRRSETLIKYGGSFEPEKIGPGKWGKGWCERVVTHTLEWSVYLKEPTGAMGSVVSSTRARSTTAPLIACHVDVQEGNRHSCHRRLWVWNRRDVTLRHADKWRPGPSFEGSSSEEPDASWRLQDGSELDRTGSRLIRLKRINNFWCSMLVLTPFA